MKKDSKHKIHELQILSRKLVSALLAIIVGFCNMPIPLATAAPVVSKPKKPTNQSKRSQAPKLHRTPIINKLTRAKLTLPALPSDLDLSTARVLPELLVPMSTERVEGENAALGKSLFAYRSKDSTNVSDLTNFLAQFPKSRWAPSLELNLRRRLHV